MPTLKIEINAFLCGKPMLVLLLFFKDIKKDLSKKEEQEAQKEIG